MSSEARHHRFLDVKILEAKAEEARRELKVFLAGPYIDVKKPATAKENSSSNASASRFALYKTLSDQGVLVILGEHERLKEFGEVTFKDNNNAVLFERKMILNKDIDAVIIFPSSPGSFLEFGDWANDKNITRKLLVIIDAQYEKDINYLNLGPVPMARTVGAKVEYVDYEDHSKINEIVVKFMENIVSLQNIESSYGRR